MQMLYSTKGVLVLVYVLRGAPSTANGEPTYVRKHVSFSISFCLELFYGAGHVAECSSSTSTTTSIGSSLRPRRTDTDAVVLDYLTPTHTQ